MEKMIFPGAIQTEIFVVAGRLVFSQPGIAIDAKVTLSIAQIEALQAVLPELLEQLRAAP